MHIIKLPSSDNKLPQTISVGWTGQNEYEEVKFDSSSWLKKFPNGIIKVFYKLNTDGKLYPIANITTDTYIWKPQASDFPKPGRYSAQAIMENGTTIGKSDIFYFDIKKSLDHLNQMSDDPPPEYPPSYILQIMNDMEEYAERAEAASEHMPYMEDGKLYIWDSKTEQFVEFSLDIGDAVEAYLDEHPIDAPVQSVNGKTGAVDLEPLDIGAVSYRELDRTFVKTPYPTGWNRGSGVDASVLAEEIRKLITDIDINRGEVNGLSALVDDLMEQIPTNVSDLENDSGYQTASDVKAAIIPFEIPVIENDGTYTTTASAADIRANIDNCVLNFNGTLMRPSAYGAEDTTAQIIFSLTDGTSVDRIQNTTFVITAQDDDVWILHYETSVDTEPGSNALIIDWNNKYANAYNDAKAAMQEGREVYLKIPNSESSPTQCAYLQATSWDETYIVFGGFTSAYLPGEVFIFTYAHITDGLNNWFKWTTNFTYNPVKFNNLAEPYSASSTYVAGDYVSHDSNVYKCTSSIETPEEWNVAHWKTITIMDELSAPYAESEAF